jgi:2-haloacid dehalogenase
MEVNAMYKAIIFDLDNTLLDYSSSELFSMKNTIKAHGFLEKENFLWDEFWREFGSVNMVY